MTATARVLDVRTAVLAVVAAAAHEGRDPADIAMERYATARTMAAICAGQPDVGDATTYQQQAAAYHAAADHFIKENQP